MQIHKTETPTVPVTESTAEDVGNTNASIAQDVKLTGNTGKLTAIHVDDTGNTSKPTPENEYWKHWETYR